MNDLNLNTDFVDRQGALGAWIEVPEVAMEVGTAGISDAFKLSNTAYLHIGTLYVRFIPGCSVRENAVDMNRGCHDIWIERMILDEGAQNALTIKGGCRNITIDHLTVLKSKASRGHCELELGNHSDQSFDRTTGVKIGAVECSDGSAFRYRVGHADPPVIGEGRVSYQQFASWLVTAYVWIKHFLPFIP